MLKNKIIIESYDGLGDIIMSLPVGKYFYNQGNKVDYIVKSTNKDLFKNLYYINNVYTSNHVVDFSSYDKRFFIGSKLSQYHLEVCRQHQTDSSFEFCGIKSQTVPDQAKKPEIILNADEIEFGKRFIVPNKINVVCSLISNSKFRTYYYYKDLLKLLSNNSKFNVIFTYDREHYLDISCTNLSNRLNLRQFLSVIYNADIVLSVDTSAVHIAGSFDVPVFAIFTTLPPEWRTKYYCDIECITPDIDCFPCNDLYTLSEEKKRICHNSSIIPCIATLSPIVVYRRFICYVNKCFQ